MRGLILIISLSLILVVGSSNRPVLAATKAQITITGNTFSTGSWETTAVAPAQTDPVQAVLSDTKTALVTSDNQALYSLMASSFTDLFTADNLANTFSGGSKITAVSYLDTTQTLPSEWREQQAQLTFSDGTAGTYNLIFHLEAGTWKLYATEEL